VSLKKDGPTVEIIDTVVMITVAERTVEILIPE
jgi:hypothetical protein